MVLDKRQNLPNHHAAEKRKPSSLKKCKQRNLFQHRGYTVWDAGVQYEPNRHIKVGLNINNLTDKRYYESYANRGTNQGHFYGEPRNVTLNFKWTM